MPSKRPTTDDTTPADGPTTSSIGEYDLPKTVVTKIAKSAFEDPTVKVQQDVFLALQKAATVYINYIASAAQETANAANRKTINVADIYTATTEHLSGIGGDANAADELRRMLDEELAAFRVNQEKAKEAKAAGITTGSKRGFPGKKSTTEQPTTVDDGADEVPDAVGDVAIHSVDPRDPELESEEEVEDEEEGDEADEELEAEDLIEQPAAGGDEGSEEGEQDAEMS